MTRWLGDRRRANSLKIVILVLVPVFAGLGLHLAGAAGSTSATAEFGGGWLLILVLALTAAVMILGLPGWASATSITIGPEHLTISDRGRRQKMNPGHSGGIHKISSTSIKSMQVLTPAEYHSHYARFAQVELIGNATAAHALLLINLANEQIVLALPHKTYLEAEQLLDTLEMSRALAA